jgi:hypothetical protein
MKIASVTFSILILNSVEQQRRLLPSRAGVFNLVMIAIC